MCAEQFISEITTGENLFSSGKTKKALEIFNEVIRKNPENIRALNNRGVTLNELHDYYGAIESFTKVIRIDGTNSDAIYNLISNYIAMPDWSNAEMTLEKYGHLMPPEDIRIIADKIEQMATFNAAKNNPIVYRILEMLQKKEFLKKKTEKISYTVNRDHIKRLQSFLNKIKNSTYPEPPSEPHISITKKMINYVNNKIQLRPGSKILDVGCGQGPALEIFLANGHSPIGITLNQEDLSVCKEKGYTVYEMDQSFLDFDDQEFDFIWCRHCIEHSIFPFFTLSELFRVLRSKGHLYIEVPAPDTVSRHQINKNHYSVMGKSMWAALITRAGFHLIEEVDISFEIPAGADTYYAFFQQKP